MIDVTVKTLDSQNHAFSLNDDVTVKQFKEQIAARIYIPANTQRLIYCGKVLQDEKPLSEYDVNGKVIHLVQRAPPSVSQRSNTSQNQGQTQSTSGGDWTSMPRIHYRQAQFHGNPMYVGSVSFPADVLEGYEWPTSQINNTHANRHITVIRRMLDQANRIIDRLDNPSSPSEPSPTESTSSTSTSSEPPQQPAALSEPDVESGHSAVPRHGANISLARINSDGTLEPIIMAIDSPQISQSDQLLQSQQQQEPPQSSSSSSSQQQPGGSSDDANQTNDTPVPREFAELLEKLLSTQDRLKPYIRDRLLTSQRDTTSTSTSSSSLAEENQRIIDSVTECFHCLSHAQHALSNLSVNMQQSAPRTIRCRPTGLQPSAILQAGLPIQVEAHINLRGQNDNNNDNPPFTSSNTNPTTTTTASESSTDTPTSTSADTNTDTSTTTTQATTANQQQQNTNEPQPQSNTSSLPTIFNISNNVEVVMEMGSRVLNFSSDQNRATSNNNNNNNVNNNNNSNINNNSRNNGANNNSNIDPHILFGSNNGNPQITGGFSVGAPPSADIIRNLMQAVAGYMAQTGVASATIPISSSSSAATPGGMRQRTVAIAVGEPTSGQNSQTRGNTETHPTTATQTRTTSRTHVIHQHAQALGVGVGLAHSLDFDPLLPCTSYYLRRGMAASTTSTAASTQTGQANRSTGTQVSTQSQTATTSTRPRFASGTFPVPDMVGGNTSLNESIANAARISSEARPVPLHIVLINRGIPILSTRNDIISTTRSRGLFYVIFNLLATIPVHSWMNILNGDSRPLKNALPQLRNKLRLHYANIVSLRQVEKHIANDICAELRQHLDAVFANTRITDPNGKTLNMRETIENLIRKHIKTFFEFMVSETQTESVFTYLNSFGTELASILRYALRRDFLLTTTRFARSITSGSPRLLREWVFHIAAIWFYNYSQQVTLLTAPEIDPLLVYEEPKSESATTSSSTASKTDTEPMEVDAAANDEPENDPLMDGEEVPRNFPGHNNLLPDWVPIIARDGVRQRRQLQLGLSDNNVTQFSDAYLSTMPSKRRKLVEQQKPSLLVNSASNHSASAIISASMERLVRESVGHAGVEEVDGAIAALVAEPTVRRAFGQAIRESLNPRRYDTPDFPDPLRFPDATKFFTDSNGPSK